ncbi:MAG: cysteine--tRNA ligase [Chloroflexi bacterium]|nr:cysteine--tRNA ligase [Chloroflexota bacterium]
MPLKLYSTLTRQKEDFIPRTPGRVTMYVCGPNLYGPSHVGHAFSYILFDTVKRYMRFRGYTVRHVQNFTDIEDRIIATAQKGNTTIHALAETYIQRFLQEMDALNVLRADAYPRATGVIPTIIEITQGLIAKGYAYTVDGDVYFRVRKDPDYGKLSHRSLDDMEAGARIQVDERKVDPMDFALWKSSKPGEPSWDSPWGPGRPGWHIECSAMNLVENGEQIDLHGGGHDVIFPHHENEIAQSESFTGKKPFAKYWMHNALLRLATTPPDEEMHRHIGNTLWIRDALAQHEPDAIRLYLLSTHYRTPLAWTDADVNATARGLERLRAAVAPTTPTPNPPPSAKPADRGGGESKLADRGGESKLSEFANETREKFVAAMDDDFGTPQAVAALHELAREINRARGEGAAAEILAPAQATLRELAGVLGLTLKEPESGAMAAAPFVELLIAVRKELRVAKQFALADKIRQDLAGLGITLEDGPQGTTWKAG